MNGDKKLRNWTASPDKGHFNCGDTLLTVKAKLMSVA